MTIVMPYFLSLLLLKHYIADFILQTPYQLKNKGEYGHWGGILHAAIHMMDTLLVLVFLYPWQFAFWQVVIDGVVHYHIDWIKAENK